MTKPKKLTHQYSGPGPHSREFWRRVNALGRRKGELYGLGVALQVLEEQVIKTLADAERRLDGDD
jgi:hypothetical protein